MLEKKLSIIISIKVSLGTKQEGFYLEILSDEGMDAIMIR